MTAADEPDEQWGQMLARWAIPGDLVAAVPASPYYFDPTVFSAAADKAMAREEDTPSDVTAREALPVGGTVLDVGVGAGAASLRLGASHVIGVDPSSELLGAFAQRAARLGIGHTAVEGRWPEAAPRTSVGDVVVCHHVVYNVADLAAFAAVLADHAVQRVVIELTAVHPMAWMAPYWKALHDLDQPDRPTADDAVGVLVGLRFDVHQHRWRRPLPMIDGGDADQVARLARRLCLPPARHPEVRQVLALTPPPTEREVATLWWDP